jgi:hypothetical protein
MGKPTPIGRGELIRCWSDHDDYACSHGEVAMSGSDGTGPSTQMSDVRRAWAPMVMSYHARCYRASLPENPTPMALPGTEKTPGRGC